MDHPLSHPSLALLLAVLVGGCAAPLPLAAPLVASGARSDAPAPEADAPLSDALPEPTWRRLGVQVRASAPPGFTLDGDVAEWGSLREVSEAILDDAASSETDEARAPTLPAPPESFLAVALTGTGMTVAGQLARGAASGFWLSFGSPATPVPQIGELQRSGGVREIEQCDYQPSSGPLLTQDEVFACNAILARHARLGAKLPASFLRRLWVDPTGVRAADEHGALAVVPGAAVRLQPTAEGAAVELLLPVGALPNMASAPLTQLQVLATEGRADEPPMVAAWPSYDLPSPVHFEPLAKVRQYVFNRADEGWSFRPSLSYAPGESNILEVVYPYQVFGNDRPAVIRTPLYERAGSFGQVELAVVGEVGLVSMRDGAVIAELPFAEMPKLTRRRGEDLHLFRFTSYPPDEFPGWSASWTVAMLRPDGGIVEGVWSSDDGCPAQWRTVRELHDASLTSFGVSGVPLGGVAPEPTTCTWRWSAAKQKYLLTITPPIAPPARGTGN